MQKISAVYKITNNITGDFYIGSSNNIERRWTQHKSPSTWATKPGMKLYQDIIQYGLNNFEFVILEETNNLRNREQYWIEQLQPSYNSNNAKGLNKERFRKWSKEYYNSHKERIKEYYKSYCDKWNTYQNKYQSRLCLYNGETLTLATLYHRFRNRGIAHPFREAKKYLLDKDN